jgi:amino acid permease
VIAAIVLAIIAILCIIAGVIYVTTAAKSLPSFLPGHIANSSGHHPIRAVIALIVGVILLVGAWFTFAYKGKESAPAGQS